jgi:hypothetical protein
VNDFTLSLDLGYPTYKDPILPHERFAKYNGNKCWQSYLGDIHKKQDLMAANLTPEEAKRLRVSDFDFEYIPKTNNARCKQVVAFIKRHEWLGKMPTWVTHRFCMRLNVPGKPRVMAGVIIMATPNAFSNLLGKEMRDKEKLIARGACISFSPKNLGSHIIMESIKWMVKNTEFRFFTAYSDPEAKELGTIYQAANFQYLGQTSGTKYQYFIDGKGWKGDKSFSERSSFVRYAKELGYVWQPEWRTANNKVNWENIPDDIKTELKQMVKEKKSACEKRLAIPKHKYVYVLGRNRGETKYLRRMLFAHNPKLPLPYPKIRGS